MLFDSMMRVQKSENGIFAASNPPHAPVFWIWLAGAIPVALLDLVSVTYDDDTKDIATVNFEIKLVMLIRELMKMCDDKERIESAKLKRAEIDVKEKLLTYIDSIRHGRIKKVTHTLHEFSTLHRKEELIRKSLKKGSRVMFQAQYSSPDVGYSPFERAQDWKAFNRVTIARRVEFFDGCAMVMGLAGTP